ncbi:hypothetical protein A3K86_20300 [Photobacterium jeanii]|uniref:Carbamoyltransferase HypF n=1 Tax=Photobacterium jeanii TaxID=858640 RepID=A0A178K1V3_9GAMM|nr:carbamoyltransferase HypF [Photobacterium jeanii]OAN11298.1 hypothetical protein A3K86_20300 [Photobacterium jeanii]PST90818.1 carbamoyltransferase HypF [Photobacterium jeanii]
MDRIRLLIHVTGIVQGVGFRPFIYKLAKQHGIVGYVLNNGEGVSIEAEGENKAVTTFYDAITTLAPPLSRIDSITATSIAVKNDRHFDITESDASQSATACVSPDQGVCEACLADIKDPTNRHYRYPFTNCTHCGPRYTLIKQLPYDRKQTSMAKFAMCPSCAAAYADPEDRRYHAQPVSCPDCGPWVSYYHGDQRLECEQYAAIEATAQALAQGKIIAVKGIGGFHLMCNATDETVVAKLRQRKRRQRKPLAVMMKDSKQAKQFVEGSEQEWQLVESQQRPITLFRKKESSTSTTCQQRIASNVAPNIPYLGVMLPYTPLHYLLFELIDFPLIATSANISGFPILSSREQIFTQLSDVIDGVLDHNREIVHCCDDSLVQVAGGRRQTLRLARGYAPYTFSLPQKLSQPILAVGAQQKVTFSLGFADQGIVSPHIGDMEGLDMQQHYQQMLDGFQHIYQAYPSTLVCDKHPSYMTTQWAQNYSEQHQAQLLQLQHHHAHIVAVMAEHQTTETVLGFAFDGTGFGDDHQVWGGEVLVADHQQAERVWHLRPFRLIGGEKAIKEPYRILLGLLLEYYSFEQILAFQLAAFRNVPPSVLANLHRLWQAGQNSPYTTSFGRLVDAFTCLLGLVEKVDYEGECGMRLEALALDAKPYSKHLHSGDNLGFSLENQGVIDPHPLLSNAIDVLVTMGANGTETAHQSPSNQSIKADLANQFFDATVAMMAHISSLYPEYPVVVSGGVFQNRVLMDRLDQNFKQQCRRLLTSEYIPLNDGGIAMGQLWYGIHAQKH